MTKIKLMKVLICIYIVAMVLLFTACACHSDYDGNEEVSQTQINISEQESETDEEQEPEEVQETTLESSPEAEMAAESETETEVELAAEPEPKTEMVTDANGPVEVSALDYDSFQSRMTDEEWEGFQQYFPVLKENVVFHYTDFGDGEELNKSGEPLKEGEYVLYVRYRSEKTTDINRYVESYSEDGTAKKKVEDIRVFDLDGDDVQELIIQWCMPGDLLVLHCEEGEFYGWEIMYRGFESLRTNGVYISSGGAGYNCWQRIRFDNGSWLEEVLYEEDWGEYYIGGEAVDEDTFVQQQADFFETEEVTRYEPINRAAVMIHGGQ